jgi:ER-derived vesicles protein
MDQVRPYSRKAEDLLATFGVPIKPYIPVLARFLLVATFFEDSIRICTQWSQQIKYLETYQRFWSGTAQGFLFLNVMVSIAPHICP